MEILTAFASKLVESLVAPVGRHIGYVFTYKSNIQQFRDEVQKLKDREERVKHEVEDAKGRRGEDIEKDVERWLEGFGAITENATQICGDEDKARMKCFAGLWCPNMVARYQLGKQAKEHKQVVADFIKEGEFKNVGYRATSSGTSTRVLQEYEDLHSRKVVLQEIMEALADPNVKSIGVYGLGGVGKTTLMKSVVEEASKAKAKMFDAVVLAAVGQNPDSKTIQRQIADHLGFQFDGVDTVAVRSEQLRKQLKRKGKVLIILDDIWERIELGEVGIPFGAEHEGCKLLVTSRDRTNLVSQNVDKKFNLEALEPDEAWRLFEVLAGDVVNDPSLQGVPRKVAEACGGLPISLVTVARALREGDLPDWKEALRQLTRLENEEYDDKTYSAMDLSYKFLKGDEIKSLFRLCAHFGSQGFPVEGLLRWVVGLGLFKGTITVEEARIRLYKLMKDLKYSCLLLEVYRDNYYGEEYVRMHDVVRRFARSVASKDHHCLIEEAIGAPEFQKWLEEGRLEHCEAIALIHCKISKLPSVLESPNVESFLLEDDKSLEIPKEFLGGMTKLKFLSLRGVNMSVGTSSLQLLENNLQTLCLDDCVLEDVAIVGELKKLQVLSLSYTNIVQLPREIGQLTGLKILDLTGCQELEVIPPNVLSCLKQLEDLHMWESFREWGVEGQNGEGKNASLAELMNLPKLVTLYIEIKDATAVPNKVSENLKKFKIFAGDSDLLDCTLFREDQHQWTKDLALELREISELNEGVKLLLTTADNLELWCEVVGQLDELDTQGFPLLKHLRVSSRTGLDDCGLDDCHIILNPTIKSRRVSFPSLVSLDLCGLRYLEKVCHDQLTAESFSNLRELYVRDCSKLKNIFPSCVARSLSRLEKIEISNCGMMEEIITGRKTEDDNEDGEIEWTRLREVILKGLPELTSFYSSQKVCAKCAIQSRGTPSALFCGKIVIPNLEVLKLSSIKVKKIWDSQLERVESCDCKSIEKTKHTRLGNKIQFPQLNCLELTHLSELVTFGCADLIECRSLKVIYINYCPKLKTFISSSINGDLAAAEKLQISDSALFNEKIVIPNLEDLKLSSIKVKKIWGKSMEKVKLPGLDNKIQFSKLKCLELRNLPELMTPGYDLIECPSLKVISIDVSSSGNENLAADNEFQILKSILFNKKINHQLVELRLSTKFGIITWKAKVLELDDFGDKPVAFLYDLLQFFHDVEILQLFNIRSKVIFPTSASVQNLTTLVVTNCNGLVNLVTSSSTAKFLEQLKRMSIKGCNSMTQVVRNDGDETENEEELIFRKLEILELHGLRSLTSFCSTNHSFQFPSLMRVDVVRCPRMKVFSEGFLITPNLKGVAATMRDTWPEEVDRDKLYWEGDLNKTIKWLYAGKVGLTGEWELNLSDFPELRDIRHDEVPIESFSNARSLVVEKGASSSKAVSCNLLWLLNNLYELDVRNCETVEEVFDMKELDVNNDKRGATFLSNFQRLKLSDLPILRRVWNEESQGILDFKNLRALQIHDCGKLRYVFTPSIAMGLKNLWSLEVKNCSLVEEIITKGVEIITKTFPKLESIVLESLPSLTSFCSGSEVLVFVWLREITAVDCPRMKTICFTFNEGNDEMLCEGDSDSQEVAFFNGKVKCPGLRNLTVDWNDEMVEIRNGKYSLELICQLHVFELSHIPNEYAVSLTDFLKRLPNLRKLVLRDANFEELALQKGTGEQNAGIVTQLGRLQLSKLPNLRQLSKNHSEPGSIIEDLKYLSVSECGILNILLPSSVRFQNLRSLDVSRCHWLLKLLTSSTAKSLVRLGEMTITECDKLEEIVSSEGDEVEDEIVFDGLWKLEIKRLPRLTSFCSGNHAFRFPLLGDVDLDECQRMKFFVQGALKMPNFRRKMVGGDEWARDVSLNTAIQLSFPQCYSADAGE